MTTLFRLTKYQKINGQVDNEDSREDKPGSMFVGKDVSEQGKYEHERELVCSLMEASI